MPTASIERAAPAARSSFWMPPSLLGYDDVTGPPFLGNQHDTVRCGFLPRRSYVAPSRRSRGSAKRARKELTYCPIYGFKPCVICAKDLTPALFCCLYGSEHAAIRPAEPKDFLAAYTAVNCRCPRLVLRGSFLAAYTAVNHLPVRMRRTAFFLAAYTAVNPSTARIRVPKLFLAAYTAVNQVPQHQAIDVVFLAAYTAVN